MTRLTDGMIDQVIYDLQGTCRSLEYSFSDVMEFYFPKSPIKDIDDLTTEEELRLTSKIDETVFCCAECSWWFEAGYWNTNNPEADNGDICLDCMPEEDD